MGGNDGGVPPILAQKHYAQPSAFTPENLLREARRQKRITASHVPEICVLDPDGDIVRSLLARGEARLNPGWACYHTQLYSFSRGGIDFGVVGCAVGASYAVLVAEEMFASGYSGAELRGWANAINSSLGKRRDVYAYFNNDAGGHAPRDAQALLQQLQFCGRESRTRITRIRTAIGHRSKNF